MKWLGGSALFSLLVIWTVVTLMGVDPAEGAKTSSRRGSVVQRGSRTRGNARTRDLAATREARRRARQGRKRGGRGGKRKRDPKQKGKGKMPYWKRNGCEEIYLPMCKGQIPYKYTKLPNQFNHTTQAQVFRKLQRLDVYMDNYCSRNLRLLLCSNYVPKCNGRRAPKLPCKSTCLAAKDKCAAQLKQMFDLEWEDQFSCEGMEEKQCIGPVKDRKCPHEFPQCKKNQRVQVCRGLPFKYGALPNMFGQCHAFDINKQLRQFKSLRKTKCHPQLDFMLCGTHSPFCVYDDVPFTFPCREICEEVRASCEAEYKRLNHNLPWPRKLQCHIYPKSDSKEQRCVMPDDKVQYTPPRRRGGAGRRA
ncbi:frizzled-5 [Elysia marginata]|uniref:Frizzled-5 n=1 Tax=Elysia marginata TaxID=1093978 RepID=A0AAV4GRW8_9GAST|nr:frizzled-5 [Elysia marginata]